MPYLNPMIGSFVKRAEKSDSILKIFRGDTNERYS
jgi:hypothetical protein